MEQSESGLLKFNKTNLVNAISEVMAIDKKSLSNEVKEFIWPRLDFLKEKSQENRFFLFEEDYVETEWKDMISIHYINTSYKVRNNVMRIHIFLRNEITEESYGGFFTLRKIDETGIMLSFIYPDWKKIIHRNEALYVMTYVKKVHIRGVEMRIHTYPLFVQDNITVACAQADMISMTKYLHHKFDSRMIRIKDIGKAYSSKKTKQFPTSGLNPVQMIEVFDSFDIPINYLAISNEEENEFEDLYRQYVDYSVESGIPVLLGGVVKGPNETEQRHVVQVIGHTKQDREQYVVYDDSGCFLRAIGIRGFVAAVTWNKIYQYLMQKTGFIIYPVHEKVYLSYDDIKVHFQHMFNSSKELISLEEQGKVFLNRTRYLLVDNRILKQFIKKLMDNSNTILSEKNTIRDLLKTNMSHYVWYCEVPLLEGYLIFFADPTYGKRTTKNIFYADAIFSDTQLSLLSYE